MRAFWSLVLFLFAAEASAQSIRYITPDAAAPGMSVCVEIIGENDFNEFGEDGLNKASIVFSDATDTAFVIIGPTITSWRGRIVNAMFFIREKAQPKEIRFKVRSSNGDLSNEQTFKIVIPENLGELVGNEVIGRGGRFGTRSPRNTLVVDSLVLTGGKFTVSDIDPDDATASNQSFLPLTILSAGPVRISGSLSVSANGRDAIAGGAGGGAGAFTRGGHGYTGGGGVGERGGHGSGEHASNNNGGPSMTGAVGGEGDLGGFDDQGGGGGTAFMYGTSGQKGGWYKMGGASNPGGIGGGSAGGEHSAPDTSYGGGGGGHALDGGQSGLNGDNRGKAYGNRMLVPITGGSGAGAGNRYGGGTAGTGGGGGGAITIVGYDGIVINEIASRGGDGESTTTIKAGGGGGGAGGAIQLSTHSTIEVKKADISGGVGGTALTLADAGGLKGGDGSHGRFRTNGKLLGERQVIMGSGYPGPSIQKCAVEAGEFMQLHGTGNPGDSILIYFWSGHTGWSFDRPRIAFVGADSTWFISTTLSGGREIYVATVQATASYSNDPNLAIPHYVMSHTSGVKLCEPDAPVGAVGRDDDASDISIAYDASTERILITGATGHTIEVFDVIGRKVGEYDSAQSIPTSDWAAGTYVVRVSTRESFESRAISIR